MSDFTVNDTMVDLRYELDDREIYNDIRSEIGILTSETVVDADATYSWKRWKTSRIVSAGEFTQRRVTNHPSPLAFKLENISARIRDPDTGYGPPYYSFRVFLTLKSPLNLTTLTVENFGPSDCGVKFDLSFKYLSSEKVTHAEIIPITLTVRATNATSMQKYGRRVMNLTWAEGTEESDMQALVNHYITRYAEPVARLICRIKGSTDTLRTQIITREISDLITVVCTNLGINADCFINAISISDDPSGIPSCTWELEIQRTYELLTLFTLDTSELDGAHVLGS